MNFRSVGSRYHLMRGRLDKLVNALRVERQGFLDKKTSNIQIGDGNTLTIGDQADCDALIQRNVLKEGIRDELAFLELLETIERVSRYYQSIKDPALLQQHGRILMFAATELTKAVRKEVDLNERDLI